MLLRSKFVAAGVPLAALLCLRAQDPKPGPDFAREIQPIFEKSCYSCHGPKVQSASLRLDSKQSATATIIVPGKSADSERYKRVAGIGDQARMPMGGKLAPNQIALIKAWIDNG